ncbi:Transmembrane protein TMEM64 protein [Dioscorea alata]|uniref:Transmembrane protein TMEM64 protein n=2 Tax=Dioscorea alata TaxID=55571 RepID=A0ACB7WBM4_DIOAL|nr:Transmembrane protein TMEM64 protein [Dioscorea alata]KAH7685171.1 Transmembrane protein TMEM64 protein [Dioscorea alata]
MLHGVPSHSSSSSPSPLPPMIPLLLSSPLPHLPFPFLSSPLSTIRTRRFPAFRPLSSLKESKNPTLRKASSNVPQSFKFDNSKGGSDGPGGPDGPEGGLGSETVAAGSVLAGILLVGLIGGVGAVGFLYKEQINAFLNQLSVFIEGYGPAGYALFVAVYTGLEVLAIPAIPLTMSAGLLFGTLTGTIIVSISGTLAASASFLIARYFARERILKMVKGNKKFLAIDKAIGENGFKVVTLLRLSPLLPFSLGNYLYGLTSVKFVPYVLGSWLGMLPGTWAYVSAGAFGRAIIQDESEFGVFGGNNQLWTLGLGLLATALAATYVTRLAKDAVKDIE